MNAHSAPSQELATLPRLLTVADVRDITGVSRMGITRLVKAGELPVVRIGTRLRFEQADIAALIARGRSAPAPAAVSGQHD
jgi:excisionase family DNA binding protein